MLITAGIIDDDKNIVDVFSDYLKMLNVKVVSVGYNGKDAVELYKKYKPDVLFLDLLMPDYDGIYGLENIRVIDPRARVVIVTADITSDAFEKLDKLRPTEIILKPFEIKLVKTLLDKISQMKNTVIVSTEKKALISFTITQALLRINPAAADDIGTRLYAKYGCYFSDCLEHPEYLKNILYETFGNGSAAIIETIRESLAGVEQQQEISDFLYIICK